jgi:signal transduction histidine kinase
MTQPSATPMTAKPGTEPIDILLVDDEPRNLDALEAILENEGYRLLRAEDADSALKVLLEHQVAAIVLDIKMPRISGIELAGIIKGTKRFRQVPILFLTAHLVDDTDIITGYGAGAVDYLTKPFNPQILRHKVGVYADLFQKTRAFAELNEKLEQRVRERTAELEKSEQALRAAARQKDEFIATLAHELRNPLVPLRTGLDLLMQMPGVLAPVAGEPTPSKTANVTTRTLAAMNRQLDHIVRLIDDLLDVSRISSGVFELKFEKVSLVALVSHAVETAQTLLQQKSLALTVSTPSELQAVVDPTRLSQIVGNLLHNASKFTPSHGTIRLELEEDGNDFVIRVIDSGVGIAADQLERVFEMFARVDNKASPSDRGAGIGLALARRLAQMHGGDLDATSPGPGQGATFTLRVPCFSTHTVELTHPFASAALRPVEAPAMDILVIEDNEDAAETLASLLSGLGNNVAIARTGRDGVEQVRERRPQLVLCDIGLPDMDGNEVCKCVRESGLDYRPTMIALTGWGQEADRKRTREAGFDRHLVKPVTLDMLREVLRATAIPQS